VRIPGGSNHHIVIGERQMATNDSTQKPANVTDLSGQRFGSLTVAGYAGRRKRVHYWHVICDCGNEKDVAANNLKSGATQRCSISCPTRVDPRTVDEIGNVYGKLTVIAYVGHSIKSHKGAYWRCRCECGTEVDVVGVTLRNGKTRSCSAGCGLTTHGMKNTPEYYCWKDMKARCGTPSHPQFGNYGARGIKVCDRWEASFETFLNDMGMKPFPEASLDRIDNEGDYCPENCRWATREQQHNNKRTNRYVAHNGETLTVAQWAKRLGIPSNTIHSRLDRGWPVEHAMTVGAFKFYHK